MLARVRGSASSASTTPRLDAEIVGVRCIGLNKVQMPGNLVALDLPGRGRGYEILGEWPRREQVAPGVPAHEVGEEVS